MTMEWKYMLVTCPGPLIIARVPIPPPRWRAIMKGLTSVMREHGLLQKDIGILEGYDPEHEHDAELVAKFEKAFAEGTGVDAFWLYEWQRHGGNAKFVKIREGKEV